MQLSKQTEKEVLQMYDTWLHSYLHGDVATYDSYFDDAYHFIGSTGNEEFLNRKDTTKFFENTAEQLAGKCDLRKETRILEQFGELVFLTHVFDAWFLNGADYSYYGRFRFTNILQENKDGWRFIYQHFSTPDSKTGEGETIGFDKVHAENQELREAIKRRTIELEQKNRELEIEAALERVRARSMAMHHTSEIQSVIHTVHEELLKLNISIIGGSFIVINADIDTELYCWGAGGTANTSELIHVPHFGKPFCTNLIKGIKQGPGFFTEEFTQKEKKEYFTELFKHHPWSELDDNQKKETLDDEGGYTRSCCVAKHTSIFIINQSGRKFSDEENDILKRFSKVFEQTYTRFLDLQKAEAQAKEARIEAALERVRAQTMAMHNSEDVGKCIVKMFDELTALGVPASTRFGIGILNHDNENNQLWTASKDGEEVNMHIGNLEMNWHPLLKSARKAWKAQVSLHEYVLEGEDLRNYYQMLNDAPDYPLRIAMEKLPERQFHYGFVFEHGFFYAFSPREFQPDLVRITQRFSSQFAQTYRRYLDLVKAEAQAREARIEAALERVRSRSLAMHKTDELQEVVRVLAEELKYTGVILDTWGAVICTYFQDSKDVLHWTAAEDPANPSVAFLLPYFKDELYDEAWASKNRGDSYFAKVFSYEVKNAFFKHAFEHSDYRQLPDDYKQMILQSDSHGIAWAWANNSAIMIPSIQGELPSEQEKEILVRFAKVFEQAYIRFLDLQTKEEQARKLAEEKQRLEKTLHDLRVTQKQLIQSEKMASLGELTAGIAHEIQNPLNFVNNFAEVSSELIDEMIEEMEGGDMEEAKAIATDIQQNLEKINHHGKRAESIVKGMLQHSRTSTGEKVSTDINQLADEYLRLAYHGLRAKDKYFNVTLNTDFDPTLEKVSLVPQDIGRVLLNLFTNAFYAVQEKKKNRGNGFEPRLEISTKNLSGQITIVVKDNGNGIPQNLVDKIFQPFFTTKPTGQGTGLGLSLSYDIIKAHDGQLEVETEEGSHTVLKISLPKSGH